MPLTPGSTFERYEIQGLIGRGGMGEVYRALDTRLNRPVALKVLRTDPKAAAVVAEAGGVARLLREARAAAALNHANSVAIYELGEAEGIAYIAMELVTGVTFRRYLGGEGNVSVDTKVSWLVDAARALWAAHRAGLVHRDVKPGNIMVSDEGVVKVLDFGLAKATAIEKKPDEFQTMMGQVLGTPRYMAPEQLEGCAPDASADQFAFGLTAYELISGIYAGGPLAGVVLPLHERVRGIPEDVSRAVARMMSRQPRDRFPTMEAAAHALRSCVPALAAAAPPPPVRFETTLDDEPASNAPTVIRAAAAEEAAPVSREVPVPVDRRSAMGATLPLGMPMQMAIGESGTARSAPVNLNKTMPLARPMQAIGTPQSLLPQGALSARPASDPGSGSRHSAAYSAPLPGAPSGVYSSRSEAEDAARRTDPRHANLLPPQRPSRAWILLLTIAVLAVVAGGIAAWMSR